MQSALERLSRAETPEELRKLDASFTRLYNAGAFTVAEFRRLDGKLFEKLAELDPYASRSADDAGEILCSA